MRPVLKAFASDHPVVVFIAVLVRWVLWTAAGNPVAVLATAGMMRVGLGWRVTAVVSLIVLMATAAWGLTGSPLVRLRWVWLWWRMCRFRLRWPTVMASVNGSRQTVIAKALSRNNYSVPGGLRPILDAPALGWLPRIHGTVVSWPVRPTAGRTLSDLAGQVDRVAANYRIVDRVDVDYRRSTDHRGRLVVSFADELADVREPTWA